MKTKREIIRGVAVSLCAIFTFSFLSFGNGLWISFLSGVLIAAIAYWGLGTACGIFKKEETPEEESDGIPAYSRRGGKTATQYAPALTRNFVLTCKQEFVAFDTETTGLSRDNDRMVEISAVRFRDFEPTESWSTLINASVPLGAEAATINHIDPADLENAPKEAEAIRQFSDFVGEDVLTGKIPLVAHNASFDAGFLTRALERCHIQADPQYVDTLALSRRDAPDLGRYKLGIVARHYGIQQENAHRAADDALVCGRIFSVILQGLGDNGSTEMYGDHGPRGSSIIAHQDKVDPSHPLYKKRCVFTGELKKISRLDAAQAIVDIGGMYGVKVTKSTDFLIAGKDNGEKSKNRILAEQLISEGSSLQILTERQFLKMLQ